MKVKFPEKQDATRPRRHADPARREWYAWYRAHRWRRRFFDAK